MRESIAHQRDRRVLEGETHRPEAKRKRMHDREHRERLDRRDAAAHEEGEQRLDRETDHGRERQRKIESSDVPVGHLAAASFEVALSLEQVADRGGSHETSSDRLYRDSGTERQPSYPRARHVEDEKADQRRDRHADQTDDGAPRHQPGFAGADEHSLQEAPVADRARPRQEEEKGAVGEIGDLRRQTDHRTGQPTVHTRDQEQQKKPRRDQTQEAREVAQLEVAHPIAHE
jgi:hypothetical protein